MTKRNRILDRDIKLLWGKAGNNCSMPVCKTEPSKPEGQGIIIGEMAHIKGERVGAPRWDPSFSSSQRRSYSNLILLCPNHHTEIDEDTAKYTVDYLLQIKA